MSIIKQSLLENAGNGVFATKNYKKGDYVCFYDCEQRSVDSLRDFIYSIKNPFDGKVYIGFNQLKNEYGTGQFINDYCMFRLNDDDRDEEGFFKLSSQRINDKIDDYTHKSQSRANVAFKSDESCVFQLYASKKIKRNDELYFHYGAEYWISNIRMTTNEPFTRLYCLLKQNVLTVDAENVYLEGNIITPEYALKHLLGILPNGPTIQHLQFEKYSNFEKIQKLIDILN